MVCGGEHPALAGRDALGGVEREGGNVGDRADGPVADGRAERMRGVLDDGDVAGRSHLDDLVDPAWVAAVIDRDNRLGPRSEHPLDLGGVDLHRHRVDVGEHRPRAHVLDHLCARAERQRCGHDLVTGTNAERDEREVQRRGARGKRDRPARADMRRERRLEFPALRSVRQPAALQCLPDGGQVFLFDQRAVKRDVLTSLVSGRPLVAGARGQVADALPRAVPGH